MKNPCAIPVFLLLLAATAAAADEFPASDIEWRGHFGKAKGRAETLTLLGSGTLRTPLGPDLDKEVGRWLAAHPEARARILGRSAAFAWVWVRDGDDSLNVHLVRTGQCVAGTMAMPLELLVVPRSERAARLERARAAEWEAIEAGLGVWGKERYAEERHRTLADHLESRKRYAEAAAEYERTMEFTGPRSDLWRRVATCREKAGDDEGALAARDEARKLALAALVREDADPAEVLRQLEPASLTAESPNRLCRSIRGGPDAMEELARCLGTAATVEVEVVRAINLVKLAIRSPADKYTDAWWRRYLLLCELKYVLGRRFGNRHALLSIVRLVDDWETIGLLEQGPCAEELRELRRKAK
jgi:hypothetical protein